MTKTKICSSPDQRRGGISMKSSRVRTSLFLSWSLESILGKSFTALISLLTFCIKTESKKQLWSTKFFLEAQLTKKWKSILLISISPPACRAESQKKWTTSEIYLMIKARFETLNPHRFMRFLISVALRQDYDRDSSLRSEKGVTGFPFNSSCNIQHSFFLKPGLPALTAGNGVKK